ncbi:MAG: hypothetical protein P8077_04460 [Gammaproteobacteria bacterium]
MTSPSAHAPLSALNRYLARWAEPEIHALRSSLQHFPQSDATRHPFVISVPAYAEPLDWWLRLSSALADTPLWWIWVFNKPDHPDQKSKTTYSTSASLQQCKQHLTHRIECGPITLGQLSDSQHVVLVDRCSSPIPHKQGVGLARKIANDLALVLIDLGWVHTPWLFNTDADATLPPDYFSHPSVHSLLQQRQLSAFQMGFEHQPSHTDFAEATWCYDQYLRYHYRGLRAAGSPYAFTTIGSLSVLSATHYASVRGFPKLAAGEDFYVLNKLRKLAPIETLAAPIIQLSARPSERVPFGTGPRLLEWQHQRRENIHVWSPEAYRLLGVFLTFLCDHTESTGPATQYLAQGLAALRESPTKTEYYTLYRIAHDLGIDRWLARTQAHRFASIEHSQRAFHDWFDALKTSQFLRQISTHTPLISIQDASRYSF